MYNINLNFVSMKWIVCGIDLSSRIQIAYKILTSGHAMDRSNKGLYIKQPEDVRITLQNVG